MTVGRNRRNERDTHATEVNTLDAHGGFYVRMRVVIDQLEILAAEGKKVLDVRIDAHRRQSAGLPGQLLVRLINMIQVQVHVPKSVDEITRL